MPARTWGDGATSQKQHVIEDLSFDGGWTLCTCGHRCERGALTQEDAWDIHRGSTAAVVERSLSYVDPDALANDDEVGEFLGRVMNPAYFYGEEV